MRYKEWVIKLLAARLPITSTVARFSSVHDESARLKKAHYLVVPVSGYDNIITVHAKRVTRACPEANPQAYQGEHRKTHARSHRGKRP
jgi:hypothetical protein